MVTKLIFKFYPVSLIITIFSFAGCSGCESGPGFDECVGTSNHSFQEEVIFEPQELYYHIGDTIWVSSKFSCQDLLNSETGTKEDFCGLQSIGSSVAIHLLHHFPVDSIDFVYALDNFDFVNVEGEVKPYNRYASDLNLQIKDTEYNFKFGIISKVVGTYLVFISDSGPVSLRESKRCDTGIFKFINGNSDNNITLLEQYTAPGQVSEFERTHNYCFKVIE